MQVAHYLVRVEPFTRLAMSLQDGRFDHPDRLFLDVAATWQGCMEDMADVKELVSRCHTHRGAHARGCAASRPALLCAMAASVGPPTLQCSEVPAWRACPWLCALC